MTNMAVTPSDNFSRISALRFEISRAMCVRAVFLFGVAALALQALQRMPRQTRNYATVPKLSKRRADGSSECARSKRPSGSHYHQRRRIVLPSLVSPAVSNSQDSTVSDFQRPLHVLCMHMCSEALIRVIEGLSATVGRPEPFCKLCLARSPCLCELCRIRSECLEWSESS